MKLRALRLQGFKSFADRTEVVFHDGITAVVGPNGCGKSNISDAIRWVLGEQRPTAIRGAKMEEAIFQGTVNRRPVNRGSVTMEVSNEDRSLPIPFTEVEIARTVYRDGGSDYSLNRSPCRLKDIHDLCRDTGLGANAYSIIENRMVDAILSDRAEERRGLFEEASGIGKYKDRRKAASRRLERAEIDLQRLEDLIAEVQSKVRSLARQKGKAERYRELRARRLDVEITLVGSELETLGARLHTVRGTLAGDLANEEGLHGRVAAQESRLETLRAEQLALESARGAAAARVEEVKGEIIRWERELAVAEEKAEHATRRLERIEVERGESVERRERAVGGLSHLHGEMEGRRTQLEAARESLERHQARALEVREALARVREEVDAIEGQDREIARRVAQLHGDAEASEARADELDQRISQLDRELAMAREEFAEVESQGDLFTDRVAQLAEQLRGAESGLENTLRAVAAARDELQKAREVEMAAQDRHGRLSAEWSALDRMERDREGVDPATRAAVARGGEGVVGILADAVAADPEIAATVDACLGALLKAIVVRDSRAAADLARWFREEWRGGGGLILLPLDRVPETAGRGGLLDRVTARGAGAPWVRALLDGVELADSFEQVERTALERVARGGAWVDRRGALWLGNPLGSTGLLERKERLESLTAEVRLAEGEMEAARARREGRSAEVSALDAHAEEVRATVRRIEDSHREALAQEAAGSERRGRIERTIAEVEAQTALSRTARDRSRERVAEAVREREALLAEEESLRARRTTSRERLDSVQEEWEEARAREAALTVERTRLEGEAARLAERQAEMERTREEADLRIAELERERSEHEAERERAAALREEGTAATGEFLRELSGAEAVLVAKEADLAALRDGVADAERLAREARAEERAAAERRHHLELEAQELQSRTERLKDRLEAEWGRPLERLLEEANRVDGEEVDLREELKEVAQALDRLGPVNLLAVEEHEEESTRLGFLTEQRDDLVQARNDLREAIREINQTATRLFTDTFQSIRENFRATFLHLFEGGECDLWLADPDDPLESAIEIHAAPRGKKTQRIDLLSGGERALTALSLLFGIYLVKPSPFCVLDEVDAPLDEANIGRFIRLLHDFKAKTQFIVITHNPRTIEAADWIYGVTMEEPGVSTVLGVKLEDALEVARA